MCSDQAQVEWIVAQLVHRYNVLVWPTVNYGYYPAFADYPGNCSLSRGTWESVVKEILVELSRQNLEGVVILNSGVSTKPILQSISITLPFSHLINIYDGPRTRRVADRITEQSFGGHADELETSILLAIDPAAVVLAQASPWDRAMQAGPLNRYDSNHYNYSPAGITGDPTRASAAKGRMLLAAMLDDVSESLWRALDLSGPA